MSRNLTCSSLPIFPLFSREADFSIGPYTMTAERAEVIDFTFPITTDYWTILLPMGGEATDPWVVARPLDWTVWTMLIFTIPCVILTLWALGSNNHQAIWEHLATVCGYVFRSVLLEPPVWIPNSSTIERLLGLIWSSGMFVLCCSFAGVLTSLLTQPLFKIPIDRQVPKKNFQNLLPCFARICILIPP